MYFRPHILIQIKGGAEKKKIIARTSKYTSFNITKFNRPKYLWINLKNNVFC